MLWVQLQGIGHMENDTYISEKKNNFKLLGIILKISKL